MDEKNNNQKKVEQKAAPKVEPKAAPKAAPAPSKPAQVPAPKPPAPKVAPAPAPKAAPAPAQPVTKAASPAKAVLKTGLKTGNPGDSTYRPQIDGVPVNIVAGGTGLVTNLGTLSTDIETLDTDVKALTAAITPAGTLYAGTTTAPISSGTAIILKTTQTCKSIVIQVPAGGVSVKWGSSAVLCNMTITSSVTADAYSPVIPVTNANLIYVISTGAAQVVNWFAIG